MVCIHVDQFPFATDHATVARSKPIKPIQNSTVMQGMHVTLTTFTIPWNWGAFVLPFLAFCAHNYLIKLQTMSRNSLARM
jgi:hypothetical protein